MNTATCERCAQWLEQAREVRGVFNGPDVTPELELSARLRLKLLGQRLVLHDCSAVGQAVSA
jgi:hypothetical protein